MTNGRFGFHDHLLTGEDAKRRDAAFWEHQEKFGNPCIPCYHPKTREFNCKDCFLRMRGHNVEFMKHAVNY
jgi:hypothetical protein